MGYIRSTLLFWHDHFGEKKDKEGDGNCRNICIKTSCFLLLVTSVFPNAV